MKKKNNGFCLKHKKSYEIGEGGYDSIISPGFWRQFRPRIFQKMLINMLNILNTLYIIIIHDLKIK